MKLALNIFLFLFVSFAFGDKSYAISNYQIKKICKKEQNQSKCIKKLQEKRYNLQKGNVIEIPVIPYER